MLTAVLFAVLPCLLAVLQRLIPCLEVWESQMGALVQSGAPAAVTSHVRTDLAALRMSLPLPQSAPPITTASVSVVPVLAAAPPPPLRVPLQPGQHPQVHGLPHAFEGVDGLFSSGEFGDIPHGFPSLESLSLDDWLQPTAGASLQGTPVKHAQTQHPGPSAAGVSVAAATVASTASAGVVAPQISFTELLHARSPQNSTGVTALNARLTPGGAVFSSPRAPSPSHGAMSGIHIDLELMEDALRATTVSAPPATTTTAVGIVAPSASAVAAQGTSTAAAVALQQTDRAAGVAPAAAAAGQSLDVMAATATSPPAWHAGKPLKAASARVTHEYPAMSDECKYPGVDFSDICLTCKASLDGDAIPTIREVEQFAISRHLYESCQSLFTSIAVLRCGGPSSSLLDHSEGSAVSSASNSSHEACRAALCRQLYMKPSSLPSHAHACWNVSAVDAAVHADSAAQGCPLCKLCCVSLFETLTALDK